jgi:hypothetical protein
MVMVGFRVDLDVGEGVPLREAFVARWVVWLFTIAAMVWNTWVWFGVAALIGRLLVEIRLITYHSSKMLPAATANHTRAVKRPNRMEARFVTDTGNDS